jgi:hypothetical protein
MSNQLIKRLFWDCETSPNVVFSWRTGGKQYVNPDGIIRERAIICIAYKWEGCDKVTILSWDQFQNDRTMLEAFLRVANEADELAAHWGDRFDMPWFRTRCLFHNLQPLPNYKTIDTCAWASRLCLFNSNKLDYIAKFLGIGHKIDTDHSLWMKVVLNNDRAALAYMMRYCAQDVRLLEKVWGRLRVITTAKTHAGVIAGRDKWTCAHCGSEHVALDKRRVTAAGTKQFQMRCKKCFSYYTINEASFGRYEEIKK